MANIDMPMAEYFPPQQESADFQVFRGEPVARNGYLELSDKPGFGLELDEEVLKKYTCTG